MSERALLLGVVETIPEKCRRCYSCVRECPVKAIKVEGGQARVMPDRCIGCGNCYRVCSQGAKTIRDGTAGTRRILADCNRCKVALLAPSFPAAFMDHPPARVIGAIRRLGFDHVAEVAFGADLNSSLYRQLRTSHRIKPTITTACPAIVYYVQKYAPALVPNLAPVASPMAASARLARQLWGEECGIVFVGPCIGKKMEALDPTAEAGVDEVLTFQELGQLFAEHGVELSESPESEFDPPHAGLGQVFPIVSGLLRSAEIQEDALDASIISTNGRRRCMWVLEDLNQQSFDADFIDLLMCEGCVNGPAMLGQDSLFRRRERLVGYARERFAGVDTARWREDVDRWLGKLNLVRDFVPDPQYQPEPPRDEVEKVLHQMGKITPADELNCGACGYSTCREKAQAVCRGLAEVEMCLPFLIDKLESTCLQLQDTNRLLQDTQVSLIQSEKLASMGQLAAGVAHELNNPLGSILMFAHILLEGLREQSQSREDVELIVREAHRCKAIVSGLLNFARQNRVQLQAKDVAEMFRAVAHEKEPDPGFAGVRFRIDVEEPALPAWLDPDQFRQVLDNLVNNAAEAMDGRGEIVLRARRESVRPGVVIEVEDHGCGIPQENMSRIFSPFFTTKKLGKGTGLGLAIVYGIIKMHQGQIEAHSQLGRGTIFRITLPDQPPLAEEAHWI
jgi:signal transduction histidine kinase/iron only hydrogenase large subunit-like protein